MPILGKWQNKHKALSCHQGQYFHWLFCIIFCCAVRHCCINAIRIVNRNLLPLLLLFFLFDLIGKINILTIYNIHYDLNKLLICYYFSSSHHLSIGTFAAVRCSVVLLTSYSLLFEAIGSNSIPIASQWLAFLSWIFCFSNFSEYVSRLYPYKTICLYAETA